MVLKPNWCQGNRKYPKLRLAELSLFGLSSTDGRSSFQLCCPGSNGVALCAKTDSRSEACLQVTEEGMIRSKRDPLKLAGFELASAH
ncbi:hypothetical protein HUJ05_012079 [Dendroctonus ponderosae]|nr:hypothetical protein HUJ05_012079 [Dendroctonus ponderosae]